MFWGGVGICVGVGEGAFGLKGAGIIPHCQFSLLFGINKYLTIGLNSECF